MIKKSALNVVEFSQTNVISSPASTNGVPGVEAPTIAFNSIETVLESSSQSSVIVKVIE